MFRLWILSAALSLCLPVRAAEPAPKHKSGTPHAEAAALLHEWGESLLKYQSDMPDAALNGGLLCPGCGRIHGRCLEAVLPFMRMAYQTGEQRWTDAARRVMRWGRNVKMPSGAWMNDINVSDWDGTTVFGAIALYEALHHYGGMLDDSTRTAWREDLRSAGEFIYANDFIYSRRREGWRNMNVNYSASATYALYALGDYFEREDYKAKAHMIASDLAPLFTAGGFLYGEGQNLSLTPKGCLPVDLLYNVEESLPNLANYAVMAGDQATAALVERAMRTHLEFMLPDGAWDDSWGTRSFKWCYWGGRTSDGFMGGYYLLGAKNPAFDEAVMRNIRLLRASTRDGLLAPGRDYVENGFAVCIHHTFGHAKALASMLALPERVYKPCPLPREQARGVTHYPDINTWLVATGLWRATLTDYDSEYKVKGTHPMGGALSMLWHQKTGPLFAASMNAYTLIEAPNMQLDRQEHKMCATPRVELIADGMMYSNLDDLQSSVSVDGARFTVRARLVDARQAHPAAGPVEVEIRYGLDDAQRMTVAARVVSGPADGVRLILPVIAPRAWTISCSGKNVSLAGAGCKVSVDVSQGEAGLLASNAGRILSLVPGFGFVPVAVSLPASAVIKVD